MRFHCSLNSTLINKSSCHYHLTAVRHQLRILLRQLKTVLKFISSDKIWFKRKLKWNLNLYSTWNLNHCIVNAKIIAKNIPKTQNSFKNDGEAEESDAAVAAAAAILHNLIEFRIIKFIYSVPLRMKKLITRIQMHSIRLIEKSTKNELRKKDQAKKGKIFIDNLWKRCEYIRFIVIWAWLNDAIAQFNAAVHFNNCAPNSIAQTNTHSHRKMHAKWNRIILILHLKTTWREWTQDARPENPTTLCAGF